MPETVPAPTAAATTAAAAAAASTSPAPSAGPAADRVYLPEELPRARNESPAPAPASKPNLAAHTPARPPGANGAIERPATDGFGF
jgi:hypothetical protein